MAADTREAIMDVARGRAQALGYAGLSFREIAREIGIKSASIHYHFPTKADLGAALARDYTERARADLDALLASHPTPGARLRGYAALFRKALEQDNRMCLCGILAAEHDETPEPVRAEVAAFADLNIAWLAQVLAPLPAPEGLDTARWAQAIHAAVGGAQLAARGRGELSLYDAIIKAYRASALIPD